MDRPTFKSASHNGVLLREEQKKSRSFLRWGIVIVAGVLILVLLFVVPFPYVVRKPGVTLNVLGSANGVPMLQIEGTDPATGEPIQQDEPQSSEYDAPAKPGQSQLRMTTITDLSGGEDGLSLMNLLDAYCDPHSEILHRDEVIPADWTLQRVNQFQLDGLDRAKETSQVAAFEYLGWEVPATVTIEGAAEGANAEGIVQQGDILRAITTPDGVRHEITSAATPFALMHAVPAGSTITLTVERGGTALDLSLTTITNPDYPGSSLPGIVLLVEPVFPLSVSVQMSDVSGGSVGLMLALGIIDRLTPGDMTGGNVIAGTGTMSYDGQVGGIGGIQQKLWGAHRDGAQWFLAPSENCNEVVGHVPDGLRVVSVSTLDEAVNAVRSIADGTGDALPTCQ